jgi:hypothetical protein
MDTAVSLVQSYLYLNGYFTVTEYPILQLMSTGEYRTITDVDVLAVRFPGAGRVDSTELTTGRVVESDPDLGVDDDRVDMIIGEVKEGAASLNPSARDPQVLRAALHRFGVLGHDELDSVVDQLVASSTAVHSSGARVRLVAFGSKPPREWDAGHEWFSLGHIGAFMHQTITEHWDAAQTIQSKDPALSFLLLLEKAVRGES